MTASRAEQILLQIVESAQQLDSILAREMAHQEAFQPESVALRTQVEDLGIQLIFLGPRDYSQKAEDLLWRKVYGEVQHLWKSKGALVALCSLEGAYRSHLKRGIDVYHRTFFGVQASFQLDLEDYVVDWTQREQPRSCASKPRSASAEDRRWARKFCHRCLLRIGDLYRYGAEFLDPEAEDQAGKYYYKALALIPEMGLPFLHLATLSGAKYSYIQAVYFLQCCLSSPLPHGRASVSLQLVYGKVEELYLRLTGSLAEPLPPEQKPREDLKRLQLSFVFLQSLLQPKAGSDCRLESVCQEILEKLPGCLSYLATKGGQSWDSQLGGEQQYGSWLPDQTLFQMVILCILSVQNLTLQGKPELSKIATTFSLDFFAHVVHRGSLRLQAALKKQQVAVAEDSEEPRRPLGVAGEKAAEPATGKAESEPSDFSRSAGKHLLSPLLPGGPTDFWGAGTPNQEEVSDLDGNCDCYNALDVSDEWADISFSSLPDQDEDDLSQPFCGRKPTETPAGAKSLSSTRTLGKSLLLQEELAAFCGEGLLPTIKVIVQWLRTHPALTTLSMHTCPSLWSDLLVVLNLMPTAEELEHPNLGLCPQLQRLLPHFEQPDLPITPPLPEDVVLQGLLPLQPTQEKVNFELHMPAPFSTDELTLRACILRTFGHFAVQLPQSLITFDSSTGLFLKTIPQGHTPPLPAAPVAPTAAAPAGAAAGAAPAAAGAAPAAAAAAAAGAALAAAPAAAPTTAPAAAPSAALAAAAAPYPAAHPKLAEEHWEEDHLEDDVLWQQLQEDLESMERNLHRLQLKTALHPYLIVDSLALCCYLSLVRELAHSGRFIIIIPRIVIDELDELKKNPRARQALHFLECELKERNSYLRCQVELGPKSIRPRMEGVDAFAWNLYGILTSYAAVAHMPGPLPDDVKGMGTILTALSLANPSTFSYPLKLAFSTASKAGLEIQHILTFYQQWKEFP